MDTETYVGAPKEIEQGTPATDHPGRLSSAAQRRYSPVSAQSFEDQALGVLVGIRVEGWIRRIVHLAALLSLLPSLTSGQSPPATLNGFVQRGIEAFEQGRYSEAVQTFDTLEEIFGEEPEYRDPNLLRVLLPVRGYAQLSVGRAEEAAGNFRRYVDEFPNAGEGRAFAIYSLAQASYRAGKLQEAVDAFETLEAHYPTRPETALATLKRAEILFQMGDPESGFATLDLFYASPAAPSLRVQGRIRALRHAIELREVSRARNLLLETAWSISTMPELALLAFSALDIGDQLLKEGQFADAIRSYRYVPPKEVLVDLQKQRLTDLQNVFRRRSRTMGTTAGMIWKQYYSRLIEQIEEQLRELEFSVDYTPGFLLRFGQALLLDERHQEAWVLFQALATDASLSEAIRSSAHYRWILSLQAMEEWDRALEISRQFIASYPNSPLAPQTHFLIAQTYQEQRRYRDAAEILDELAADFPDHHLRHRWIFARGFCYLLTEEYDRARAEFQSYLSTWPDGSLILSVRLWHGLSWLFQKRLEKAREEFTSLIPLTAGRSLQAEVLFHRASTLYSMRNHTDALADVALLLKDFPEHPRVDEANFLRGEILMGQGQLESALDAFSTISDGQHSLATHATFQIGKLLRALQEYHRLAEHFQAYLESGDPQEKKPRVAEALYWTAWAYDQLGHNQEAFPMYHEALEKYGNDLQANEIGRILSALQSQYTRLRQGDESATVARISHAKSSDFESWLGEEVKRALESGELTYYARLNIFIAQWHFKRDEKEAGTNLMLQTVREVPIESLAAETLGTIGLFLGDLGRPSARLYLETILENFPKSPHRASAYYGLARNANSEARYEAANLLLEKFAEKYPVHTLSSAAALLNGKVLLQLNRPREAMLRYEEILRLKGARGRPHGEALDGLAEVYRTLGEIGKAIAHYQRIYTLYRAYPDLVAKSYLQSALLFEQTADLESAEATLEEFLSMTDLNDAEVFARAREEKRRIAELRQMQNVGLAPEQPGQPEESLQ